MGEKLQAGDKLPTLTLKLTSGQSLTRPADVPSRYLVLLFYRGHWCPYCMRHLLAYEQQLPELSALEASVIAVSVDPLDKAQEVIARGLSFPVAYGATRQDAELLGSWWDDERKFIQPSEFVIGRGGIVLASMYASGPVGRMSADEVTRLITNREKRRLEQAAAAAS
jgi:peroxiredoxin